MQKQLILLFLSIFVWTSSRSQYMDSTLTAEKSHYINNLLAKKEAIPFIMGLPNKFVHPRDKFHIEKPQLLFKTDSSLLLSFSGSGRVYQLSGENDTSFIFSRIDLTENINYNLGAHYFTYKEKLYSFGGYGFWKTNGNLKLFNFKDKQWDIVPLSEEVIPQFYPIEPNWFNASSGKFYVPLQSIVNAGISGTENLKGKVVPYSFELDINTKKWKKLGQTNPEAIKIITNGQTSFRLQKGVIILYYDKTYFIDFVKNKLYISNNDFFNQSLSRKGAGDFVYESNGQIYSYNYLTKATDSLILDYTFFKDTGIPIWEPMYDFTVFIIGILVLAILTTILYFRKRKLNITASSGEQERNYHIQFTDTEIALLNLLIDKIRKSEKTSINEVNYVLGLKNKNIGLQKKVRSDTFNSINDKFRYISKTDEALIQSVRSEVDKRYFEYFINKNHINILQAYLK